MAAAILLLALPGRQQLARLFPQPPRRAAAFIMLLVLLVSRVRPATGALVILLASPPSAWSDLPAPGANLLSKRFGALDLTRMVKPCARLGDDPGGHSRAPAPAGYGHGAFVEIYYSFHDTELGFGVFDHAHNDWLQTAAEPGLPARGGGVGSPSC
ncbi:MAG: hypothetical protein R3D25_13055 [Geminicoccaceae bacterium]